MRIYSKIILLFMLVTIASCSGYRIQQDYNKAVNFSKLKTYAWTSSTYKKGSDSIANTSLIKKRIRSAVDLNLAKKGYRKVSRKNANFLVRYHFYIIAPATKGGVSTGVGVGKSNHGKYGGISLSFSGDKGESSRISIDALNPKSKRLWWRGSTKGQFSGHDTPKQNTEKIYKGVAAIIKKFPPK